MIVLTCRLALLSSLSVSLVGGCGARPPGSPPLAPSGPRLPEPPAIDPTARGAGYLTAAAAAIQPAWGQFLEDCRLRLPRLHPLNAAGLTAVAELAVAADGKIAQVSIAVPSGNGDFDTAAFDVLGDASPLPPPPPELRSDDELVHLRWLFARDVRQAGPATARVVSVELPLLAVVGRMVPRDLARAARRVAAAPAGDPDRIAAAEHVMVAALREALASANSAVRRAAVDAIGRARLHPLAGELHPLVAPTADPELRLAAIAATAALGDPAAAPALLAGLGEDFAIRPRLALARTAALVALGRAGDAAAAIRGELAGAPAAPSPTALAALALAPDPELAPRLPGWLARGDARTRAAVCTALPAAAPAGAPALIVRGLRDADATVRATCAEAAARPAGGRPDPALVRRLRELARDRDRTVRARAVAALATVDPGHRERAVDDPAPEVRAAAALGASEPELRALAGDRDAEVRAAALVLLADRAPELAARAAGDPSPLVRRAAIAGLTDEAVLARLAGDPAPDVATAAAVRIAGQRGRAAITAPLLTQLAAAPPGGVERVRIALAWLLAS